MTNTPSEGKSDLQDLLDHYFSLGVAEGKEGRDHDTSDGEAQATRDLIGLRISRLERELAEHKDAKWKQQHVDTMNDMAALRIALEGAEAQLAEARRQFETAEGLRVFWNDKAQELAGKYRQEWQPIETAPKDKTSVIIAVPTKDYDGFIVGEAYFDPEHYEDGDWWWANTDHGDYHGGPVSEINHHGPSRWQPLPVPPEQEAKP